MECAFDFDICRICRSSLQKMECPQAVPEERTARRSLPATFVGWVRVVPWSRVFR
jgi:hypothetical protein